MQVREVRADELAPLGRLMVGVYGSLEGFPSEAEQPEYFELLANVGRLQREDTKLLVAVSDAGELLGGVVYMMELSGYGATAIVNALRETSAFRLLAVAPAARSLGVGKALVRRCLELARARGDRYVVIHTSAPMKVAWAMYERMGFSRAPELDFENRGLAICGFRLAL